MSLMLDTSAYSEFKRGDVDVIRVVRMAERILMPTIVYGELLAGFEMGLRAKENKESLREFVSSVRVEVVSMGPTTAERYEHIYRYLRLQARPVPASNMWIAASAMEYGATLVTFDAHFAEIPQIVVDLKTRGI